MIKIENIEVFNLEGAMRGMRNPMNSWHLSDSEYEIFPDDKGFLTEEKFVIGKADMKLAHNLCVAGHPHRKYLRQIFVSMDITAPIYWWKEFDTYKVGVTRNSCSTMHKIHAKEFVLGDFSHEHFTDEGLKYLEAVISRLNVDRQFYNTLDGDAKKYYWWEMIQLLPSSYNQKSTITCNYENIVNMIQYRSDHKLDEWQEFCKLMLDKLPYLKEILNGSNE